MFIKPTLLLLLSLISFNSHAGSSKGITINAAEIGIGKFHRKDNTVNTYSKGNSWSAFILGNGKSFEHLPIIQKPSEDTYTVFFSSLDQLLKISIELSKQSGKKIEVFNINAHGMPGGMWFPKDDAQLNSLQCSSWLSAAKSEDEENYNQYYSPISKSDVLSTRRIATVAGKHYGCVVGLAEWQEMLTKNSEFKNVVTPDLHIHFLSCTVGLGVAGEYLSNGIAKILFSDANASIQTALNFGLGDWSMPEGMGFWDYFTDEQLNHDNEVYPKNRSDREIMKKGTIRVSQLSLKGGVITGFVDKVDFMQLGFDTVNPVYHPINQRHIERRYVQGLDLTDEATVPKVYRIPGTKFTVTEM